ncbi:MAG: hypothetical protein JXA99_16640 [Candidatus Lokiarchaeota archaeon]|nr:hypothetical protein [Candidatus Lokiarchaeota archaeon]
MVKEHQSREDIYINDILISNDQITEQDRLIINQILFIELLALTQS